MSPLQKPTPRRPVRASHTTGRHLATPPDASDRSAPPGASGLSAPQVRPHVAVLGALDQLGWRVTELRPSTDHGSALWIVSIERTDFGARMTVTDADPDVALEELARYASVDATKRAST